MPDELQDGELQSLEERFFSASAFAVVGASNDLNKYGAKVFAGYRRLGLDVFPINPKSEIVQGVPAFASLGDLPSPAPSVSIITPPAVTERVVEDAAAAGAEILWLQPGSESPRALELAREHGLATIHGGPCILVAFSRM